MAYLETRVYIEYCDMIPKIQSLGIWEMLQKHPLLGNIKHQSWQPHIFTTTNPNTHVYAQQFAAKQYVDSMQANTGSPHYLSSNPGNMSVMTELTGKSNFFNKSVKTQQMKYSQTSDHEQFGLRTNFPNTKRLGWRTVSRVTNMQAINTMER
jgi:hypothetical protein